MGRPHPLLFDLAAGRSLATLDDHDPLLRSAREHRMTGLVFSAVQRGELHLPRQAANDLLGDDLQRQRHTELIWDRLARVQAVADGLGIELATVKGVTAEARWYSRTGERAASDLDVVLRPDQLHRARDLVAALQPDQPLLGRLDELIDRDAIQAVEVIFAGISLDVHFDLLKVGIPSRISDDLWERTVRWTTRGRPDVRVLDPVASLVFTLVHLNKDRFRQLSGLADVVRIIERDDPEWGEVERLAHKDGLGTAVRESLRAVQADLGLDSTLSAAQGGRAHLWRLVWRPQMRLQGDLGLVGHRYRQAWLPLTMRHRLVDTLRYWWHRLAPPAVLVEHRNSEIHGGYLRRLVTGRVERYRARRRTVAGIHRTDTR